MSTRIGEFPALLLAAVLLLASGAGCGRPRLPDLTPEALAAARAQWQRAGITAYDLDLVVEGTVLERAGIHVEVRADTVARAERDGVAMTGDRSAYTVPGLFTTLARELELKATPSLAGAPEGYQVYVQATFDPVHGYPRHYRRIVGGSNTRVEVDVHRFTPQ
jgi:hypothetical protein